MSELLTQTINRFKYAIATDKNICLFTVSKSKVFAKANWLRQHLGIDKTWTPSKVNESFEKWKFIGNARVVKVLFEEIDQDDLEDQEE